MNQKYTGLKTALPGAMALFGCGMLLAAPAKSANQSDEAARLIREVQVSAQQVSAHAQDWAHLATTSQATWAAYDKQWNMIKPAMEELSLRLSRLEVLRSVLPQIQQDAIRSSQVLDREMTRDTHALEAMLTTHSKEPKNPAFRKHAGALWREAQQMAVTLKGAKRS